MPRFFVGNALQSDEVFTLPDEVTRHVQVLRLQPGDAIVLFDGLGGEYSAEIVGMERRDTQVRIGPHREVEAEPPYRVTLAQGVAGNDKMDWLIEKAVELGATNFVPLTASRSVVRLSGERAVRRQAHWQRIVQASCEQCGRNRLPDVAPARDIATWLDALPTRPGEGELRLLLSPRANVAFSTLPVEPPAGEVTVLIGPEGGFSSQEEEAALDHGFLAVGLGPRVLRTETAGIAVLAALAARWGGW
ncbi:MAG TPA: 16S rRNA (uracil(1498)-N(3))-methyltransferase [Paraburkholderia sp.]|jgi:16S rRNA (uracil1498-N3)-methyltransferase|uniref:16S rRNA (uracil(1498)-N(3))-methyltransferase n=1 Tax=Paraburkholderia sp. TaxID=1926495 RepID=UPI002B48D3A6|nr:16S rRNA (uracil(1498)-N(3))-methyltransferase [Paraburkholderia sp.]HKR46911.1 16S rRNA (uracil(1498)-N(3))-methyltransferase [Paraburkholderia sp.]